MKNQFSYILSDYLHDNMKRNIRQMIVSLVSFILIYMPVFVIPQLVLYGIITVGEGVILALPVSMVISYVLLRFGRGPNIRQINPRIFVLVSLLLFTILGSVVYLFSAHGTLNRLLLFIPIDTVILAVPALLLHRSGKSVTLNPNDFSNEYTERLHSLLDCTDKCNHDVYLSHKAIMRSFAETSNGKEWHVMLKDDAIQRLDSSQIDAVLLEAYYSRKGGVAKKLILAGTAYVIIAVDILLISSFLITLVSQVYFIYLLVLSFAGLMMILTVPFFILKLSSFLQSRADLNVIKHLPGADPFISAIEKKKSLMVPLRPMTQKQQIRYEKRMQHITEKRINRIRKFNAVYGKM